jgi:hypothetical protein
MAVFWAIMAAIIHSEIFSLHFLRNVPQLRLKQQQLILSILFLLLVYFFHFSD